MERVLEDEGCFPGYDMGNRGVWVGQSLFRGGRGWVRCNVLYQLTVI